jgi:large subunit ribosomal protein L32
MAVPKKRTSKSKSKKRNAVWKRKAFFEAQKAIALGKSILSGRNSGFIYPLADSGEEEGNE